jgi:hypothetical protein
MKKLNDVINKQGFVYTKVYEDDNNYIYSQQRNGNLIGYEVFRKKVNTMFNCESFPRNESFGLWAWSTRTLDRAKLHLL